MLSLKLVRPQKQFTFQHIGMHQEVHKYLINKEFDCITLSVQVVGINQF